jgi:hypothetical protein
MTVPLGYGHKQLRKTLLARIKALKSSQRIRQTLPRLVLKGGMDDPHLFRTGPLSYGMGRHRFFE